MNRRSIAIALAVVSAGLIVFGRINRETSWGTYVLLAGFAVLVVAGVLTLLPKR